MSGADADDPRLTAEPAEAWLHDVARIVVVGPLAAGKTTFAAELAGRLGAAHVELDELYWGPGWTRSPVDEFRSAVQTALEDADRWVVCGDFDAVRDLIWPHVELVIWLDFPFRVILRRNIARRWQRHVERSAEERELRRGRLASVRSWFYRRRLLSVPVVWLRILLAQRRVLTHFRAVRRGYVERCADAGQTGWQVVRLAQPDEAEQLLASLEPRSSI